MKKENNQNKYLELRKKFPVFKYQSYSFHFKNQTLDVEFTFKLAEEYTFKPRLTIPSKGFYKLNDKEIDSMVFHIGMIELISYWKATCSPLLVILPRRLNSDQVRWWKKLYYNGLGEFFYLNGIDKTIDDFMNIQSNGEIVNPVPIKFDREGIIVPVGGGKDSIVTLELLKNSGEKVYPLMLNPRPAILRTIETAGFTSEESIEIHRTIDPKLLELNEKGFLNGHTPFSALLAFVSILTAAISGIEKIALSNESSANESTVPGFDINHQYSKSIDFEEDFNYYVKKYINPDLDYFSFLRPVNELQIAKMFSKYPQHFEGFRSCNVGSKTDEWCGSCPKCLFTFIILSPFIAHKKLVSIFRKDLFEDTKLSSIFDELTGIKKIKPFECVGTPEEVSAALNICRNELRSNDFYPKLLAVYFKQEYEGNDRFKLLLMQFDQKHFLPEPLIPILKDAIK